MQIKQKDILLTDLKLINYLSEILQLNNSVISYIFEFTLKRNDNLLDHNHDEKIASPLKGKY